MKVVHATARKHIPQGCRKNYVPGLATDLAEQYNEYTQLYEQDPFAVATITAGDELAQALTVEQRKTWQTLIESTDMTHNSLKAWSLIKKLSNDPRKADKHVNVTPNQVAHQLILNGKVPNRQRQSKIKRCGQENHDFDDDFTIIELQNSLEHLKNGKAAGLHEILSEEINNFGPVTMQWVLSLLNACARTLRLPRLWRQARVVALLKQGKDPSSPKSFTSISLLCHLYKLYERLILNRLSPVIEHVLIPEQAGFRPGKSCTAQVLNLIQHIEDGFETGKSPAIVLVDLSAAYDTVNHRRLLDKVYNMTRDYRLMCMIRTLLENRRFFVELGGKRSRWRSQRNGLPQGSVLAPLLFNIYTNDHTYSPGHSQLCVCRRPCCHYTEHRLCTDRGNTDLGSRRSVEVLCHKPAPRESNKDASQSLPPADSLIWQTAQHQLERGELNPLQPPGVPWCHTGPNVVV